MQQILDLQELETEFGQDEEGVIAESTTSLFDCDSNWSVFVC